MNWESAAIRASMAAKEDLLDGKVPPGSGWRHYDILVGTQALRDLRTRLIVAGNPMGQHLRIEPRRVYRVEGPGCVICAQPLPEHEQEHAMCAPCAGDDAERVTTYFQEQPPTAPEKGDLWCRDSDGTVFKWSGQWLAVKEYSASGSLGNPLRPPLPRNEAGMVLLSQWRADPPWMTPEDAKVDFHGDMCTCLMCNDAREAEQARAGGLGRRCGWCTVRLRWWQLNLCRTCRRTSESHGSAPSRHRYDAAPDRWSWRLW